MTVDLMHGLGFQCRVQVEYEVLLFLNKLVYTLSFNSLFEIGSDVGYPLIYAWNASGTLCFDVM